YIRASTKHDLHSPFIFNLMTGVIEKDRKEKIQEPIENLRHELLNSTDEISVLDLGAGSSASVSRVRTIRSIARTSSKAARYARLLYRLSAYFKPSEILELGTSLGISSLYLHAASPHAKLITLEGCPAIAQKAQQNIDRLKVNGIHILTGSFEEKLPVALAGLSKTSFVFFDGNHRKAPTLAYFNQCLEKAGEDSVFIFDDIHWSPEMTEAWEEIKSRAEVTVTVDLFMLGLVFFRKGQEKQHFTLRY
ncbi:MAG TPA: class I SAM-dependent methyltransferase, partial [Bacteroidia bacterium]|nr:class I SAM-dependent methyltransferase [Bacteroidia bacterium]